MKKKWYVNIVSIGDELLNSGKLNTTAPIISKKLTYLGYACSIYTIGDDDFFLNEIIKKNSADILITCGGLGATADDKTVLTLSKIFKKKIVCDIKYLNYLKSIQIKKKLNKKILKQANYPEGFKVEKNKWGTAPFLYFLNKNSSRLKLIIALPGVPSETLALLESKIIPLVKKEFKVKKSLILPLKILGLSEIEVESKIQSISYNKKNLVSFLPNFGELLIHLKGPDLKELVALRKKIKFLFPENVVFFSHDPLSYLIHKHFIKKKLKIGFVESLTGGLLTGEFINYPGASSYLDSSLIVYNDKSKKELLNLSNTTIKNFGVISKQAALELAINHMKKMKLDLCLALTGVAGPKKVIENKISKKKGLVFIGFLYYNKLTKTYISKCKKYEFLGNRKQIMQQTIKKSLILVADFFFLKKK